MNGYRITILWMSCDNLNKRIHVFRLLGQPPLILIRKYSKENVFGMNCVILIWVNTSKTKRIKLQSKYIVEGNLSTDSKVLEAESFTDKGHLAGDPYASGFGSETNCEYGLSFYVDETNGPSPLDQVYGSEYPVVNRQQFDLLPITQEYRDFISITGSGDHIIFHIEDGKNKSFCVISSNPPSEEFKNELTSNWGLNNDLF